MQEGKIFSMKNDKTIKISILNTNYMIKTNEDESYVLELAKHIEENMEQIMLNGKNVSTMSAAVLTLLEYCDKLHKTVEVFEKLRKQSEEYKKEAETAKLALDKAKKEKRQIPNKEK